MNQLFDNIINSTRVIWKGIIIVILTLFFQIPIFLVDHIISEREDRSQIVLEDISSKWGRSQIIGTPVLELPVKGNVSPRQTVSILADQCSVKASMSPELRERGIYKAALYNSKVTIEGGFDSLDQVRLPVADTSINWQGAQIKMYVRDMKGLTSSIALNFNGRKIILKPSSWSGGDSRSFSAALPLEGAQSLKGLNFNGSFSINGSESLQFIPLATETRIDVESAWKDPSFFGDILPHTKTLSDKGFKASWSSMAQNRNYPSIWMNNDFDVLEPVQPRKTYISSDIGTEDPAINTQANSLLKSAFGVRLYVTVNDYQKSHRLVRYSILYILLTLAAFFLVELKMRKSIHPVQYVLIGLALTLFFLLQLSISEYLGFNWSYLIAAIMIVLTLAWFTRGVLQSSRAMIILSVVLVIVYGYMFTLMQVTDYALLLGSLGLFVMLLALMAAFRFQFKPAKDTENEGLSTVA